jgi:major membrane immunogen (membrane-anchored lipoprotein)
MNIKKFFGVALAAVCALVMTTALTACGGDDDDKTGGGDTSNKPVAASLNAVLSVGDDLLEYFDLTIDYYDATGKMQSEPLKESKWEKTMKASLPATLGVRLKAQLKEGVDPAAIDLLSIKSSLTYAYNVLDANDRKIDFFSFAHSGSYSIHGSDIPVWLTDEGQRIEKILYTFDTNGKYSEGSWK